MEIQPLKFPHHPPLQGRREGLLDFLNSSNLGEYELLWDCAYSKQPVGLRVERCERSPGAYYRDPYPLFLTVLAPSAIMMPQVRYPLTPKDISTLISALQ